MNETTRLQRTTHRVRGERSELRLEDGVVTIMKSATSQTGPSEVHVPIERVRSVEVRRPSRAGSGWLHLAVVDGSPAPATELAAMSDPYTIPLATRQVSAARRLERLVSDHVQRRGLPAEASGSSPGPGTSGVVLTDAPTTAGSHRPAGVAEPAAASPMVGTGPGAGPGSRGTDGPAGDDEDLTGKLRELAELHRSGALTDEEFRRAKQAVLET